MIDEIMVLKAKGLNFREIGSMVGKTRNAVAGLVFRTGLCKPTETLIGVPKPRFKKPKPVAARKPTKIIPQFIPVNNPLYAPVARAEYRRAYHGKTGDGMPFAEAVERNLCLFVKGDPAGIRTVACGCVRAKKSYCAEHYEKCYAKKRVEETPL